MNVVFPAGFITLIVDHTPTGISAKSTILQTIWGDRGDRDIQHTHIHGVINIRGRPSTDWDFKSLRERMIYMKDIDDKLYLPMSIVAGLFASGIQMQALNIQQEKQNIALTSSGTASEVCSMLPYGTKTILTENLPLTPCECIYYMHYI